MLIFGDLACWPGIGLTVVVDEVAERLVWREDHGGDVGTRHGRGISAGSSTSRTAGYSHALRSNGNPSSNIMQTSSRISKGNLARNIHRLNKQHGPLQLLTCSAAIVEWHVVRT